MAVFPTTGAFTTSPEYSGSFIPELWSNKLNAKFYASTMMTEIANTDWEGEIKNQGDTIRIRQAPSITINHHHQSFGKLQGNCRKFDDANHASKTN